jgi:galacturonosyltransferase
MEKMLQLYPGERIEMGKKAREKIIREFDKEIVLNAYLDAIDQLIPGNQFV